MRVKNSNLTELILDIHLSSHGIYYFFDGFVIAELNEGITGTWESSLDFIKASYNFYGDNGFIYISNRVNEYAVNPSDWLKFFKNKYPLNGFATVSTHNRRLENSTIEKLFITVEHRNFTDLYKAVDWAKKVTKKIA